MARYTRIQLRGQLVFLQEDTVKAEKLLSGLFYMAGLKLNEENYVQTIETHENNYSYLISYAT